MNDPILGFSGEYRWLSNFYTLQWPIVYIDMEFHTTENAYQAMKCKHHDDMKFIAELTPAQAKRAGRQVEIDPAFEENKIEIMKSILSIKFDQPKFKALLVATGDRYIEETNTWNDIFWGVCNGIGENNLGKIIMNIRDGIK